MPRAINPKSLGGKIYTAIEQAGNGDTLSFPAPDDAERMRIRNIVRVSASRFRKNFDLPLSALRVTALQKPQTSTIRFTSTAKERRNLMSAMKKILPNGYDITTNVDDSDERIRYVVNKEVKRG